jgi:hypothetical protein
MKAETEVTFYCDELQGLIEKSMRKQFNIPDDFIADFTSAYISNSVRVVFKSKPEPKEEVFEEFTEETMS